MGNYRVDGFSLSPARRDLLVPGGGSETTRGGTAPRQHRNTAKQFGFRVAVYPNGSHRLPLRLVFVSAF